MAATNWPGETRFGFAVKTVPGAENLRRVKVSHIYKTSPTYTPGVYNMHHGYIPEKYFI